HEPRPPPAARRAPHPLDGPALAEVRRCGTVDVPDKITPRIARLSNGGFGHARLTPLTPARRGVRRRRRAYGGLRQRRGADDPDRRTVTIGRTGLRRGAAAAAGTARPRHVGHGRGGARAHAR